MYEANETAKERLLARRYVVQMLVAAALYAAVLFVSVYALKSRHFSPVFRDLIAVTPALPLFGLAAAVLQFILSIDELQRQIHVEAFAIAAGVTAALAATYAFLEGVGFPHAQAWWAFICIVWVWGIALPFVRRRYA